MIVTPTGGPLGAFVSGVQVRRLAGLGGLDTALEEQGVLIFREQALTVSELLVFAMLWGEPVVQPYSVRGASFKPLPKQPLVTSVDSEAAMGWHVDGAGWRTGATQLSGWHTGARQLAATLLHCPSGGGVTLFSHAAKPDSDPDSIYQLTWEPNTLAVWGPVTHKRYERVVDRVAHRVVVR